MTSQTPTETPTGRRTWSELLAALGAKAKAKRLTEEIVSRTHAPTGALGFRYELRDGQVPGLTLRVGADGGPGVWWLAYRARGGKRERIKLDREAVLSLPDARAKAMGIIASVRDGVNPAETKRAEKAAEKAEAAKVTLRAFIEGDYWKAKLQFRKDGSGDKMRLLHVWEPILAKPLDAITRRDLEKILQDRRAAGGAASTLRREWGVLRGLLGYAVKIKLLSTLPVVGLPEPLIGYRHEPRLRYIGERGPEEGERFVKALAKREASTDDDDRMLVFAVRLAWATGMRRSEILGLRDSEVGPAVISIPSHRTKKGRARIVRLNDDAREALGLWKLRSPAGEFFPGHQDDRGWPGPAFSKWCGRLYRAWTDLCTDAGIENLNLHDLRHTFATTLRKQGVALEVVRDALGHKDLASTQIYAHVGADEVANAVNLVRVP